MSRAFFKSKDVGRFFARIFKEFAQIFRDFAKVFTQFAQISPDFHQIKTVGGERAPRLLHH